MIGFSSSWPQAILRSILQLEEQRLLELDDQLQATVVLASDRPEWALLASEILCAGIGQFNPSVGNTASIRLLNPANSGVLIVVSQLMLSVTVASRVNINVMKGNVALGLVFAVKGQRDIRVPKDSGVLNVTTMSLSGAQPSGANGQTVQSAFIAANTPLVYREPFVLGPGDSLEIEHTTVNLDFTVAASWRERPLAGGRFLP